MLRSTVAPLAWSVSINLLTNARWTGVPSWRLSSSVRTVTLRNSPDTVAGSAIERPAFLHTVFRSTVINGSASFGRSSVSATSACSAVPTPTTISGTSALRLKNRARRRWPDAVPSTPRNTSAERNPSRWNTSQTRRYPAAPAMRCRRPRYTDRRTSSTDVGSGRVRPRSSVSTPRPKSPATSSASGTIRPALSTAVRVTGGSSERLSERSLRTTWAGPKLAIPRSMTLVAIDRWS